ncbi:MAG: hypothetical protein WBH86_07475 [Thermogutta sp.]|nr:hypothetical protein [Thermogutta sp.]HQF14393.1 hypothetical protein [Thermogutta sp.]
MGHRIPRKTGATRRGRRGLMTFEWLILITLLVIGVIGAYSAVRDGMVDELGDTATAILSVDQSFHTEPPERLPCAGSWGSWEDDDAAEQLERGRNL